MSCTRKRAEVGAISRFSGKIPACTWQWSGRWCVLRKKMASDGTDETISPEKTLNCDIENFRPVTEEQFEGDTLGEQDREPGNSFSFSGETESEKDNNQSAGMSFQILSNFIIWFSFHNLWNRRIEHLTLSIVGIYKENGFFRLSVTEEVIFLYRLVCLSEAIWQICASD